MRIPSSIARALAAVWLAGCTGQIGTDGEAAGDPRADDIVGEVPACADEERLLPPQLRRLTPLQYRNTLLAVFGDIFGPADLPDFEDDNPTVGLDNDPARLRINSVTVDSVYAAARSAATTVATEYAPVRECATATDVGCFDTLVDDLAGELWRRPATPEERADLRTAMDAVAAAGGTRDQQVALMLQALLMSPNTLYRTEVGSGSGSLRQLSGWEVASLLSYTLTDAPPDAALRELAAGEALYDPEVLVTETGRLIDTVGLAPSLQAFFWDYLKLERIHSVEKAPELGLTNAARASLAASAEATLVSRLEAPEATLLDVFRGQDFELDAEAGAFFGIDDGLDDTLQSVTTDATEREGILSHPAFLSVHAGQGNTGIVKRGVFALRQLLGYALPDPPDDVSGVPEDELPAFDPDTTSSRELLQATHSRQERCSACHRVIDPAGFGFESFGPVGRYRTTEKQNVPIDASGELDLGNETLSFDDGPGYLREIAASESLRDTVLRNYFSYAMGREAGDCEMRRLDEAMAAAGDSLHALAENIVLTDSFAVREVAE